ncbi:MAG: nickel-dependent lactate racemase [Acidaminococcaceae bacterium]|nr:nickel-dependent lactate racemase [Acidaminococcaceae bacterium]MDO4935324.1 nickel-dependent lactate racemase [Phascolarctobacterium sp.]
MKKYTYAYGRGTMDFEVEESKVLKEIRTKEFPVIKDIKSAVLDAINHPSGGKSLAKKIKPGDTVAFICNDPTRVANSFDFMPILVNEMNRLGVKDEDMKIVFALGTHRLMTEEEMKESVGAEVAGRLKMINSNAKIKEDFEFQGTTSRGTDVWIHKEICHVDHVILTGTIVHHYFSGYGGGRKAIMPGCALWETVRHNHSFMLDPRSGLGKAEGNPVYDDQMESVALFAKGRDLFLFNAILNAKHEFLKIFAGDYIAAHKEACKFVDEVYGVPINKEADVVIVSCGGYPKDINVYQMQKTMDNAQLAVRKGGVVILLAECEEGSGSAILEETFKRLGSAEAIETELRKNFEIGANKAWAVSRLMVKADYVLVSGLDKAMAKQFLFADCVDTVAKALEYAEKKLGKDYSVILMPEGSLTVPLLK